MNEAGVEKADEFLDLEPLERRKRHEAGIVDDHVDAAMQSHCPVHQMLDLFWLGHISLNDCVIAEIGVSHG